MALLDGLAQPHFLVDQLANIREGGWQELIGKFDSDIGFIVFLIDIDFLQYLLSQEILKVEFFAAIFKQFGIDFIQTEVPTFVVYFYDEDGLQDNE